MCTQKAVVVDEGREQYEEVGGHWRPTALGYWPQLKV